MNEVVRLGRGGYEHYKKTKIEKIIMQIGGHVTQQYFSFIVWGACILFLKCSPFFVFFLVIPDRYHQFFFEVDLYTQ